MFVAIERVANLNAQGYFQVSQVFSHLVSNYSPYKNSSVYYENLIENGQFGSQMNRILLYIRMVPD